MLLPLVALLAMPVDLDPVAGPVDPPPSAGVFDPVAARGLHLAPGEPRVLSKKEQWLRDKQLRPDFHTSDADLSKARAPVARKPAMKSIDLARLKLQHPRLFRPGERIEPVTTLYNVWTREALPILPGRPIEAQFHTFLRDHYTNQATQMDTRLIEVLTLVALKFSAPRIEVVSGYRSPKYNLMLRKKGRQVARNSQHTQGNAVDFRVRGIATKTVHSFVRSLRLGGVGFYPHSQFVHTDTGRVRYWTGS